MALIETIEKFGDFLRRSFGRDKSFVINETQARLIRGFGRFDAALAGDIAAHTSIVPSQVELVAGQLRDMGLMSLHHDQDMEVLDLTNDGRRIREIIQNPKALARSRIVLITEDPKKP